MDRIASLVQQAADLVNRDCVAAGEQLAREILADDPRNINALRLMGVISRKQGLLDRSLEYFSQAVRLNEQKGILHFELGTAHTELSRPEEAYACYRRAIELDPRLQAAYVNLSAATEQLQRYEESIRWATRAIDLKPDCGLSYYNLANAQRELGRLPEAIHNYKLALRYKPERAKTQWNLGICQLLSGNFRDGWRSFEVRQEAGEVFFDRFPQPRWNGQPLDGKTIVVHAEQGIGDEVLFATCFPDVIRLADKCVITCDPRLVSLFARSFPTASIHGWLRRKDWSPAPLSERIDYQIPAGSLPLHFRLAAESFPRAERLLTVDAERRAVWSQRFEALGAGLKIGVSWRAGGKPAESQKRTIPLERWAGIFATPGVQFVNLQYGDAIEELATARERLGVTIHDFEDGDPLVDMDDFAAKIAALDLVISVGNATVHLAGAVGTAAWAMLPVVPSWRWMASGDESIWYRSVRLVRQQTIGDWAPVLNQVATMIRDKVGTSADVAAPAGLSLTPPASSLKPQASTLPTARPPINERPIEQITRMLADAQALDAAGRLTEAESKYREALALSPRQITALSGLGLIARKTGRSELAIRSFRRALAMIDGLPDHHFNLADALADADRPDEALRCYRQGIVLQPGNVTAHLQAAQMLLRLNRGGEAESYLRQAIRLAPHDETPRLELGKYFLATCQVDKALEVLGQAAEQFSSSARVHHALAMALAEDQRLDDALRHLRTALALDPANAETQLQLARTLRRLGKHGEAQSLLRSASNSGQASAAMLLELAAIDEQAGDPASAIATLERGVLARPGEPLLLNRLGKLLDQVDKIDDAIDCFDDAIRFAPDFAEARLNRSLALLKAGRLAEGWNDYACRWRCAGAGCQPNLAAVPQWDGHDLAGRSIVIFGEQSLSDEVMFASCYRQVIAGAGRCLIVCDPKLHALFRRSFAEAQVIAAARHQLGGWRTSEGSKVDFQICAGDLPRLLRPQISSFVGAEPYLRPDAKLVAARQGERKGGGNELVIGVDLESEAGQAAPPTVWAQIIAALQEAPAVTLIDVTHEDKAAMEFAAVRRQLQMPGDMHAANNVDERTAQLAPLDGLITAGGLAAHLAGAVGLPTFVIPPAPHWRWIDASGRVAWYSAAELYRIPVGADPTLAIAQLRQDLLTLQRAKADSSRMRGISGPHWHRAAVTSRNDRPDAT